MSFITMSGFTRAWITKLSVYARASADKPGRYIHKMGGVLKYGCPLLKGTVGNPEAIFSAEGALKIAKDSFHMIIMGFDLKLEKNGLDKPDHLIHR